MINAEILRIAQNDMLTIVSIPYDLITKSYVVIFDVLIFYVALNGARSSLTRIAKTATAV